jgi:hypothetical protein
MHRTIGKDGRPRRRLDRLPGGKHQPEAHRRHRRIRAYAIEHVGEEIDRCGYCACHREGRAAKIAIAISHWQVPAGAAEGG